MDSSEKIDIRKYLPHRKSMLMIDHLKTIKGDFVETDFKIKKNNIFVEDGFFTESGLVENIAQTCSVIAGSTYFNDGDEIVDNDSFVIGYISALKKVNIYTLPKVEDVLISQGKMVSKFDFDDYLTCTMQGRILCNDKVILDCLLNLFIKNNQA